MMKNLIINILFYFTLFPVLAQGSDTLDFKSFMSWVRIDHPLAAQAEINLRMGQMEVRQARGGFDPMIFGNLDKKNFKESTYYDKREAGVNIPTWAGVELTSTFEQNSGQNLNAENDVPSNGLFAVGASVNIGQGLILDERRATLRQAQIYQQSTEFQRLQLLNQLYVEATDVYWRWALAFSNQEVLREGVNLAKIRFEAVKGSFRLGDLAAIDTVEAYSQLLNRDYRYQSAQNAYFIVSQELNNFLWDEEGNPMALQEEIVPQKLSDDQLNIIEEAELREIIANHPDLKIADYELAGLDVERRLKSQQIIPVVKLKYNFLTEEVGDFSQSQFFENNYKWGVSVYTPLLLRKSRGALGLTNAKIDFKQNSRELKELQLRTKLESELNTLSNLKIQIATFEQNVKSLEALLQGEVRRFDIGESSLFLVNAREVTVFDSRLTLNDLVSKSKIAFAKARYAAGLGFD
jgi:outer membrane protein TolC